jgi:DNA-binding LacI/PurR family transcriptional regulator
MSIRAVWRGDRSVSGQRKATSFDIAHLAGVSQPTVSRALRGSPTVSPATRARIEVIARQLNYSVDRSASSLRSGSTRTLALLVFRDPSPEQGVINPFFLAMLGSIMGRCGERGYDLLVSYQQPGGDWQADYADSHRADGLILLGYGNYADYRGRLVEMVAKGTHFVRWGHVQPGQPGLTIGCDNIAGARTATAHLIATGARRIAFIGHSSDHYPEFADRWRGCAQALTDAGITPDPALQVDAISTEDDATRAAHDLLARGVRFDGLVAASDVIALSAMRVFGAAGLRVPDDVAVAGFDDIPAAGFASPPLTTVTQDAAQGGQALVDLLLGQIAGDPVRSRVLPTRLIVRRSSGALG